MPLLKNCLSLLSIAQINTITKSNSGRKRLISSHSLQYTMVGGQGGNWRQELGKEKVMRNAAYWLALFGSLSLLVTLPQRATSSHTNH